MSAPLPGVTPQVAAPPVHKTVLTCCSYTALMGTPAPWTCPGCGKTQTPEAGR